jgi:molecular chaperone DnaK
MINATEKSVEELADQVEAEEKSAIETAISDLQEAVKTENKEDIDAKTATLTELSGKLAERVYAQKAEAGENASESPEASTDSAAADDVVDAEFEEVKDDEDNK